MSYIYPFRMTSTTATLLLIDPMSEEVIIGVRGKDVWVHPGKDSLPGGFMEARFTMEDEDPTMRIARRSADALLGYKYIADEYSEGENAQQCAIREAMEEMGIELDESQLVLFNVRSNSRTDTRAHVTNVCYYAELTPEQSALIPAGADMSHLDDLDGIKRWKFQDVMFALQEPEMAFNHFEVMRDGLECYLKEQQHQWMIQEIQRLSLELAKANETSAERSWAANSDRQGGA